MLKLCSVSKSFADGKARKTVLEELSAEFRRGELAAVMGRSGSGKSTLFNLIAGLESPSSGKILLDGRKVPESDGSRCDFRRENIGFVFQFFHLIPHLTVMENVLLGLEISGAKSDASAAAEMLERLGILSVSGEYPASLSGGEQQRAAVARALIHSPSVILADEPTGNLDAENASKVLLLLRELLSGTDKIALMATHDPKSLDFCDARFELKNRGLVRLG